MTLTGDEETDFFNTPGNSAPVNNTSNTWLDSILNFGGKLATTFGPSNKPATTTPTTTATPAWVTPALIVGGIVGGGLLLLALFKR